MTNLALIAQANRAAELMQASVPEADAFKQAGLDPLSAPPVIEVGMSDFALATRALSKAYPDVPLTTLQQGIGDVGLDAYRDQIEAERTILLADLQAAADVQHAQSPEGRKAAAREVSDAAIRKASDARDARLLLIHEGLSQADASAISDDEALTAAGFVAKDASFFDGSDSIEANRAAAEQSGGLA